MELVLEHITQEVNSKDSHLEPSKNQSSLEICFKAGRNLINASAFI